MSDNDQLTEVTDSKGRKYKLRELDPADALDVLEAAGELSSNLGWVQYATSLCSVAEIEGIPVPMPRNKNAIRDLGRRVGNSGLVAITRALYGDIAKNKVETEVETAKN
jgi:hypothetical protein